MDWLEALVLGVVQGVTEFLPISSDGHLTLAQHLFAHFRGSERVGEANLFIDVMLHLGTLTAILAYYQAVARTAARGLLDEAADVPTAYRRPHVIRTGLLAILATLPTVPVGLFLKKELEKTLEGLTFTGVGFLITAAVLLLAIRLRGGEKGPGETTWTDALLIGIAQAFAPLPGISRSGLTIAAALGLGLSRSWAVGFSLLMAVPAILGAVVLELKDINAATLTGVPIPQTLAATIVAGLVGYGAILWLVRVVRSGRLWYFSVYLVVLGGAILGGLAAMGGHADARQSRALDRPARVGAAGPGVRAGDR